MTKIYEALEQVERDRDNSRKSLNATKKIAENNSNKLHLNIEDQNLIALFQNVMSLIPNRKSRIIQFIGTKDGEGTTTLTNEFAKYIALKLNKSVLLVDAHNKYPSIADLYNVKPQIIGDDENQKAQPIKDSFCQISMSSLFVGKISMNGNFSNIDSLFNELKKEFDVILICSPAVMDNQDDLILAGLVDGVVLIVEAEKTRWHVVQIVKDRIELQGGNILGVVLNKRHFRIPGYIYKRRT